VQLSRNPEEIRTALESHATGTGLAQPTLHQSDSPPGRRFFRVIRVGSNRTATNESLDEPVEEDLDTEAELLELKRKARHGMA
jgi:hypothetical protein